MTKIRKWIFLLFILKTFLILGKSKKFTSSFESYFFKEWNKIESFFDWWKIWKKTDDFNRKFCIIKRGAYRQFIAKARRLTKVTRSLASKTMVNNYLVKNTAWVLFLSPMFFKSFRIILSEKTKKRYKKSNILEFTKYDLYAVFDGIKWHFFLKK